MTRTWAPFIYAGAYLVTRLTVFVPSSGLEKNKICLLPLCAFSPVVLYCVNSASPNRTELVVFRIQGSKPEHTQSDQLVYKQNGKSKTRDVLQVSLQRL